MRENFTEIVVLLDRSGSMSSCRHATIEGFNGFLQGQKEAPGEANITLVQFDDKYEVHYAGTPVKSAPNLTPDTFVPRGGTALLDSLARIINETGKRLNSMNEKDRPDRVVVCILTDGGENSSRKHVGTDGRNFIFDLITHQREKYSWQFVFIGANQDAFEVGQSYGIATGNITNFASTNLGTQTAMHSVSRAMCAMRSAALSQINSKGYSFFTKEQQEENENAGKTP